MYRQSSPTPCGHCWKIVGTRPQRDNQTWTWLLNIWDMCDRMPFWLSSISICFLNIRFAMLVLLVSFNLSFLRRGISDFLAHLQRMHESLCFWSQLLAGQLCKILKVKTNSWKIGRSLKLVQIHVISNERNVFPEGLPREFNWKLSLLSATYYWRTTVPVVRYWPISGNR
jgi:hypothetical protein